MKIEINSETQKLVADRIVSGEFNSAAEYVDYLVQRDSQESIDFVRAKIARGKADIATGRSYTPEQVLAMLAEFRQKSARIGSLLQKQYMTLLPLQSI